MLYTGKGDKGDTYFFGSDDRSLKDSLQAEALGSLDEINSLLGVCRAKMQDALPKKNKKKKGRSIPELLERIQQDLFIIQAALAGAPKRITKEKITFLEGIIDGIEKELPPIKTFFLPGGSEVAALLDYARTVARRTERVVVKYSKIHPVSPEILAYLNRLSSILYALVRIVNFRLKVKEIPPSYK